MKRRIQSEVPESDSGTELLAYLSTRFTYRPCEAWATSIRDHHVLVNQAPARAEQPLQVGDTVEFIAPDVQEPRVSFDIGILHSDHDLMIVDKPANLPCHPAGRYFNHTLWAWLRERGVEKPAIINRLDRETSGLLIVALTPQAEYRCRRQFAAHRVHKEYLAIVEGTFPASLDAKGWLIPDPGSNLKRHRAFVPETTASSTRGEQAETVFEIVVRHNGMSLVKAKPHTGRLHQIRATLCSLGYPVVGDKVYGVDPGMFLRFCTDTLSESDWHRLRVRRQALHASCLEFQHPVNNRRMHFESPLPTELANLVFPEREPPIPDASAQRNPDTIMASVHRSATTHAP